MLRTNSSEHIVSNPSLELLTARVKCEFIERYGRPPTVMVAAPGRVNLIGEHIDYNDGFVLPLSIERYVVMAGAPREDESSPSLIRLRSINLSESESIHTDQTLQPGRHGWGSYVEGVVAGFMELGSHVAGFDAVIGSTVPIGGGLSSSAALEVATATLLEQLTGHRVSRREKALLCQRAEHRFAGVPCGIMDQFSSVFGCLDELMLIDCRSLEIEPVPFDSRAISVLITNSNVKHELTGGEYGERRSQCEMALRKLNQTTWRDVTVNQIKQHRNKLTDIEFRRARHVVTEIARTVAAADAFRQSDWEAAGKWMYASHHSLRDDYEVSCSELDCLVNIASSLGQQEGVLGSRMTGGGFGGCTVSLVRAQNLNSVIESLTTQYELATGTTPTCFASRPARGAHVIECNAE